MRSELGFIPWTVVRCARWCAALLALGLAAALTAPAPAQFDFSDEPLLATTISETNLELRGRWVRQWREADGALVLMFNGGFRLDMGQRRMSANNAVVWIEAGHSPPDNRKYYTLTVYLSEDAAVREPAGTVTLDSVLLVRGLRTYGQIIKYQDAYAPESMVDSPLYQQALRDRLTLDERESETARQPAVARPETLRPALHRLRIAPHQEIDVVLRLGDALLDVEL